MSGLVVKGAEIEQPVTCRWCDKLFVEHVESRPPDAPVPRMPCAGLRSLFLPDLRKSGIDI